MSVQDFGRAGSEAEIRIETLVTAGDLHERRENDENLRGRALTRALSHLLSRTIRLFELYRVAKSRYLR